MITRLRESGVEAPGRDRWRKAEAFITGKQSRDSFATAFIPPPLRAIGAPVMRIGDFA